jgi:hypothetical protein
VIICRVRLFHQRCGREAAGVFGRFFFLLRRCALIVSMTMIAPSDGAAQSQTVLERVLAMIEVTGLFLNVAQNGFAPNPTRIDASITNIFSSLPQAGIVSAATITRPDLAMSLGTLQSVALGATNAGDVILSVAVSRDSALGLADTGTSTDIPSASVIMLGENFVHDARTDLSHIDDLIALSMSTAFESWQSGSSPDATVVVINMAANGSDVSARILTHVEGAVLDARDATATALGAVNVGIAQVIGEP